MADESKPVKGKGKEKEKENGTSSLEPAAVFERVPVHDQIYDVLVYTHRNHGSASTMLFEARRIGVVRDRFRLRERCALTVCVNPLSGRR